MNSKEYWGLAEAYAEVYASDQLQEGPLERDLGRAWNALTKPRPGLQSAMNKPMGLRAKPKPASPTPTPSPTSSPQGVGADRRAARGSQYRQPASSSTPAATTPAAKPATTPAAKPATTPAAKPSPTPTTSSTRTAPTSSTPRPKDTSITDMIGRSQIRQGAPINTGNKTSDIRSMAARGSVSALSGGSTAPKPAAPVNRATGSKKPGSVYSSFDMFDLVKGHLLDEGYADTEEAAIVIMANMSEEWRENIINNI